MAASLFPSAQQIDLEAFCFQPKGAFPGEVPSSPVVELSAGVRKHRCLDFNVHPKAFRVTDCLFSIQEIGPFNDFQVMILTRMPWKTYITDDVHVDIIYVINIFFLDEIFMYVFEIIHQVREYLPAWPRLHSKLPVVRQFHMKLDSNR